MEAGYKDITLLGQNVNSYGKDLDEGRDFADLIRAINDIPGDFLIRFMTSHPRDATEKLFRTMAECEKCAKHIHLPVQSGSDRILREMNRHYDRAKYLEEVRLARELMPELVLTTDIIVGFPGETEADFAETMSLIDEVRYDAMFTFIFSPREGTKAAAMPDPVPREEKQKWFDRAGRARQRDIRREARGVHRHAAARAGGRRDGPQPLEPLRAHERRPPRPPQGRRGARGPLHRRGHKRRQHLGALRRPGGRGVRRPCMAKKTGGQVNYKERCSPRAWMDPAVPPPGGAPTSSPRCKSSTTR